MTIQRTFDGLWLAYGKGPRRAIVAEATTRKAAMAGWVSVWQEQYMARYYDPAGGAP